MSQPTRCNAINSAISRRTVIGALAAGALTLASDSPQANGLKPAAIRAIAFDAFPIFDVTPVAQRAQALFPDKGAALASTWAAKLFGYTWLVTSAGKYEEFATLAHASLQFAAESLALSLTQGMCTELVDVYSRLSVWPDVEPALERLRSAGVRLALLSNLGTSMLRANMHFAGVEQYFEPPLSTDRVRRFKPAPAAYQMAVDAFGLPKQEIGFAAATGWDAVGATWFGYRTVWVNRLGFPHERLDAAPALTSANMEGVLVLAGINT
jgi:2-haloacid dehalogenase